MLLNIICILYKFFNVSERIQVYHDLVACTNIQFLDEILHCVNLQIT